CSLKVYRTSVVQQIHLYGELHRFIPAIASWQGVAVAEMPVNHQARQFGTSKYGIGRTTRVVLDLITVRFLLSYSTRPMQVFGTLGMLLGGLGTILLAYLGYIRIFFNSPLSDRPLLLLAVLLVVLGVQLVGMGLLGELITRVYYEGSNRRIYTVRDELNQVD
ncbi:MAG: glycosyltransferase, partial [Oscillochloridaceae bacterium umkhey_bin13]